MAVDPTTGHTLTLHADTDGTTTTAHHTHQHTHVAATTTHHHHHQQQQHQAHQPMDVVSQGGPPLESRGPGIMSWAAAGVLVGWVAAYACGRGRNLVERVKRRRV